MKLIKLNTFDSEGLFDIDFSTDIEIPENCEIALKLLSCEFQERTVRITNSNNTITFGFTAGDVIDALLETDIKYNENNYQDLLNDITFKLNRALTYTGSQIGKQFLCSINNQKKFSIQFQTQVPYKVDTALGYNVAQGVNQGANNFQRTDTTTRDLTSFIYQTIDFNKGTGGLMTKIFDGFSGVLGRNFEFIIGLSTDNPKNTTFTDLSKLKCAIVVGQKQTTAPGDTPFMEIVQEGVVNSVATLPHIGGTPSENDVYFIFGQQGKLKLRVVRNNGTADVDLGDVDFDHQSTYYPIIFMREGEVRLDRKNTKFSFDPYLRTSVGLDESHDIIELGAVPQPSRRDTTNNYMVISEELAEFFEFTNVPATSPLPSVNKALEFQGYSVFNPSSIQDTVLVELLNIDLDAYDSITQGRRNILDLVPNVNASSTRLIYQSQPPIFVELKNKEPRLLRNIKLRLLDKDYEPLVLLGQTSIVLLVKG